MSYNPYSAPESTTGHGTVVSESYNAVLPTIVRALAIIAICLGGFNILGGVCGVVGLSAVTFVTNSAQLQQQMENDNSQGAAEFRKAMADVQASLPMYIAQMVLSVVASIGLIAGGIGVLRRKEWGRKTLAYSCIFYVLITFASWIYALFNTLSTISEMDPVQRSGTIFGLVIGFVFALIFLAYYVFTAYYLSQAKTRQIFQP